MVIKVYGLGFKQYFRDSFNIFDMIVVLVSIIELIISPPQIISGKARTGGGISVLRSFRLLRLFKLARSWTSFQVNY